MASETETHEDSPVRVTDHALLRYMEREKGFDVEQYRRELAAMITAQDIENQPTWKSYPLKPGLSCVIKEGHVVTIKTSEFSGPELGREPLQVYSCSICVTIEIKAKSSKKAASLAARAIRSKYPIKRNIIQACHLKRYE